MVRPLLSLVTLLVAGPLAVAAEPPATQPGKIPTNLARVLHYVPDEADFAIIAPDFDRVVAGIRGFGKAIDFAGAANITTAQIIGQQLGGRAAALDTAGPVVVAASADDRNPLLLATVLNPKAWQEHAQRGESLDGAEVFEFGDDGYIALGKGGVGIFARERGELRRALRSKGVFAKSLTESDAGLLARRHVLLRINVPAWQDLIEQQLDFVAASAYMGMAASGPDTETALQLSQWIFAELGKLTSEAQTYALGLSVDERGIGLEDRTTFKPNGRVASYLKQVRKPGRDLLRGLPADGAAVVFANEWELAPNAQSLNEILLKVMLNLDSLRAQIGAEKLDAALKMSIDAYRNMSGYSGAFALAPDGTGFIYSGVYLTSAGDALQRDVRTVCEMCPELMEAWGTTRSGGIRNEREKIGGVEADVYTVARESDDPKLPPMVQMLYGPDSVVYMAPQQEGVVFAMGPRDVARRQVTRLVAGEDQPLSRDPRVVALFEQLTPNPQFCVLVDVPRSFELLSTMMRKMGMPFPMLPVSAERTPLVGLTFYLESGALRSELFVPSAPIKLVLEMVRGPRKAEP